MTTERIIDKIRKLNAKAESAKELGSEAEAQAFADAVQRMLANYQLSLTDIQFEERKVAEPVEEYALRWESHGLDRTRQRSAWIESLADKVARAHNCQILCAPGTNTVWLVGRQSDREVAEYVLVTLVRTAESIATKEYVRYFYECRDGGDVTKARGFRKSWLAGFVGRIAERYKDMQNEIYREHGNMAIVRFRDSAMAVQNYVTAKFTKKGTALAWSAGNSEGVRRGRDYASRMDLKGNAVKPGSEAKKLN